MNLNSLISNKAEKPAFVIDDEFDVSGGRCTQTCEQSCRISCGQSCKVTETEEEQL